jgi:hypothetical protein
MSMPKYQPSSRLAKRPKLDISTDGSTSAVPNPPPSVLPQAAMEPPMGQFGFQPSSKLKTRPKLTKSTVAHTTLPDSATPALQMALPRPPLVQPQFQEGSVPTMVPPAQFYGLPVLASPFREYMQQGLDRHVRFKNPLVEGTPLHLRQVTANDNRMEGIVEGNIDLHSPLPPPSLPLPPPPIPFKSRPRLVTVPSIQPTPPSPASDPIDFPSTPDQDVRQRSSSEEHQSPKWPTFQQPPSPTTEDSESLEDEGMEERTDDDDDEVEVVEVRNEQETVEMGDMDDLVQPAGKRGKGKEKVIEDQGEAMFEESAASVHAFLLRPSIEELIKDLNLESGSGEAINGIEVRMTAKQRKADLLSRLLEAELYLAAGIDQLHDCLKTFVAGSSKV